MPDQEKVRRFESGLGFIAALDQSGGSTPKALSLYGIESSQYSSEAEMFDLIHAERVRIITSSVFTSNRVLGAILFEGTLKREVEGQGIAQYLWNEKGILPFLKIDRGLHDEQVGVQLMRDIPGLDDLLNRACSVGVLGTKARSVIHSADAVGIAQVVAQQFEIGEQVLAAGLLPILEPEINITAPDKVEAETLLKTAILAQLDALGDRKVAIKVTIPTIDDFYADLIAHPNVARVVALSGGYRRAEAVARLASNHGLIASFSRALLDGLTVQQSSDEFDRVLNVSIEAIYRASST
ncbi:fructose bisphosphate aldolase [Glaciibacter superstes]|uniref:fructose bisphosphate aldolase n=1 Tax=Glaciibacter superstes TaxID=501023 RepID=UPI0003B6AAF9|nr:fructose bisphosphate aldolase [Glaciibacter superstes]